MSGIIRARRAHTHDQMPRAALRDITLSYRARGILARLLTNADEFSMTADALAREGKEGRGAVLSALKELRRASYVRTMRRQLSNGHWVTETFVHESPSDSTEAEVGFPDAGFSDVSPSNVSFPADKSRKSKSTNEKQQQEGRTANAAAAPSGDKKRYSRRESGIECWIPADATAAAALESEHPVDVITAAVVAVARRHKSPVPGLVYSEILHQAQEKAQAVSDAARHAAARTAPESRETAAAKALAAMAEMETLRGKS